MISITFYSEESGALGLAMRYSSEETMAINTVGKAFVLGSYDPLTHYVLDGEVTERPASSVTRAGLILSDVPTGSKLYINGESYEAEGEVELEFPLPGTYQLRVECFPYLSWADEVTV